MFKNKNTRRQMIFVGISLVAVLIVGTVLGRGRADVSQWELFEFTGGAAAEGGVFEIVRGYFAAEVTFEIEQGEHEIIATLTNTGESDISHDVRWSLVKLTCEEESEWRVVPLNYGIADVRDRRLLSPGYGSRFRLTDDLFVYNPMPGRYRVVTTIVGIPQPEQVWAEFELQRR